jgi:hypothetical protein
VAGLLLIEVAPSPPEILLPPSCIVFPLDDVEAAFDEVNVELL